MRAIVVITLGCLAIGLWRAAAHQERARLELLRRRVAAARAADVRARRERQARAWEIN